DLAGDGMPPEPGRQGYDDLRMLLLQYLRIRWVDVLHVGVDIELSRAQVGKGDRRIFEDEIPDPIQAGVAFAEGVRVAHGRGASTGDVLLPNEGAGPDHGVLEPVPGQFAREDNGPAHRKLGDQTRIGLAEVHPHRQRIYHLDAVDRSKVAGATAEF